MGDFNPLNSVGFVILGAAMLWAVRLVYGPRRGVSDDLLKSLLLLVGWILVVGGCLGLSGFGVVFFSLPYLICLVLAFAAYFRYMRGERLALLWSLAIAAEHGIPLDQAARAFADERSVQIGTRAARLADLLESGVPLPQALRMSGNSLPVDGVLAAGLGAETGAMGPALQMSLDHAEYLQGTFRKILTKYFYVAFVLNAAGAVLTFVMLKIVPVMVKLFQEFELDLPAPTTQLIAFSDIAVRVWPLVLLLLFFCIAILAFLAPPIRLNSFWAQFEPPYYGRLWLRYDGALVLRSLALCVRLERKIGPALSMLADQYPSRNIARRLRRAADQTAGIHWCDALQRTGLVRRVDVAVLKAAEQAGNLAWALEEMAECALRRCEYRLQFWLNLGFPIVVLLLGAMVAFIVIALFLPLVALIGGLA